MKSDDRNLCQRDVKPAKAKRMTELKATPPKDDGEGDPWWRELLTTETRKRLEEWRKS